MPDNPTSVPAALLERWRRETAGMLSAMATFTALSLAIVGLVVGEIGLTASMGTAAVVLGTLYFLRNLRQQPILLLGTMLTLWCVRQPHLGWAPAIAVAGSVVAVTAGMLGRRAMVVTCLVMACTSIAGGVLVELELWQPLITRGDLAYDAPENWLRSGVVVFALLGMGAWVVRRGATLHARVRLQLSDTLDILRTQSERRQRLQTEQSELLSALRASWGARIISTIGPTLSRTFNNALMSATTALEHALDTNVSDDRVAAANIARVVVKACHSQARDLLSLARHSDDEPVETALDEVLHRAVDKVTAALPSGVAVTSDFRAQGSLVSTPLDVERLLVVMCIFVARRLVAGEVQIRSRHFVDAAEGSDTETAVVEVVAVGPTVPATGRIIIMSGYASTPVEGAQYLRKPFSVKDLLEGLGIG